MRFFKILIQSKMAGDSLSSWVCLIGKLTNCLLKKRIIKPLYSYDHRYVVIALAQSFVLFFSRNRKSQTNSFACYSSPDSVEAKMKVLKNSAVVIQLCKNSQAC